MVAIIDSLDFYWEDFHKVPKDFFIRDSIPGIEDLKYIYLIWNEQRRVVG